LGPSVAGDAVNFAVFSCHATSLTLVLYDEKSGAREEVPMHRTGDVWHCALVGLPRSGVLYTLKAAGDGGWETGHRWDANKELLDPYAPLISGRRVFGVRDSIEQFRTREGSVFRGTFDFESEPFDWSGVERPGIPMHELVIYETTVRTFTASPTSGLPEGKRGTFLGLKEKVPYLKELGVNALEILPVIEFDELEFQRTPNPRDHMVNIWGYSHINFFAPMSRFAADGAGPAAAAREFKEMVKALHEAGIEVILDVVYNHTAEGGDDDPYLLCMRGLDNSVYYQVDLDSYVQLVNFSGCGNTISANHPVVSKMIIDSLVQWVEEYHVDGFRFDLASALCRDGKGRPIPAPPLIREIAKHPVLSQVKLIAEPWDIGMYQVGSFPNWDVWAEWNGRYRDVIRRFVKGDPGMKKQLATSLAGSADLYNTNNRKPYHGINFVVCHDGFTLYDLVSYNQKHNDINGEQGRDGSNDNFSWNCGAEGETGDEGVQALRVRQMKNMMVALMVSNGVPLILMGDEIMSTRHGNNNYYGHDTELTHFNWDKVAEVKDTFFRFYSELIKLRVSHPLLGQPEFLTGSDVTWHEDNWDDPESKFLAFTLHDNGKGGGSLYVALNAHHFNVSVGLPPPPAGTQWRRVVDTNLPPPRDITPMGNSGVDGPYEITAYSSIILVAK